MLVVFCILPYFAQSCEGSSHVPPQRSFEHENGFKEQQHTSIDDSDPLPPPKKSNSSLSAAATAAAAAAAADDEDGSVALATNATGLKGEVMWARCMLFRLMVICSLISIFQMSRLNPSNAAA
jgi:hypothetical protein